jgi:hypothetical protein
MIKWLLTSGALLLAAFHIIFPSLSIDGITVALLAIAIIPWLGSLFRAVELPGGLKVEYRDLKAIEEKMQDEGLLTTKPASIESPLYLRIAQDDPNLALAGLRIELERELKAVAQRKNLKVAGSSLRQVARELAGAQLISAGAYLAIGDLSNLLNDAVHGAKVDEKALSWAMTVGPQLLKSIRELAFERTRGG